MTALRYASRLCLALLPALLSPPVLADAPAQSPQAGAYRLGDYQRPGSSPDYFVALSFSGGGTRAAALAYGVLEALRDTPVLIDGAPRRLLDEVDVISGVSGGSLPAAYYGAFGDGVFDAFETDMLKANVQGGLSRLLASPGNWLRLADRETNRTDLAAEWFDDRLFHGASFADLQSRGGPLVLINATDTGLGEQFSFSADSFDWICGDLGAFPLARAVAASAALPVAFAPVRLENRAGRCDFRLPAWARFALDEQRQGGRAHRLAQRIVSYLDADRRPFIHLLDGGVTDNLGVRAILDAFELAGGARTLWQRDGRTHLRRGLFIVVDAQNEPYRDWLDSEAAPTVDAVVRSLSAMTTHRYSLETLDLLRDEIRRWSTALGFEDCVLPSATCAPAPFHLVVLSFDDLADPEEQTYFKGLRTSFSLPAADVDRLRLLAGRLLRESADFQSFLAATGGSGPHRIAVQPRRARRRPRRVSSPARMSRPMRK